LRKKALLNHFNEILSTLENLFRKSQMLERKQMSLFKIQMLLIQLYLKSLNN